MSRRTVWIELYALSPREHFVCQGLSQSLSYKQIAGVLDISTATVKTLAGRAMDKLGADDWRSLARIYDLASEIARLSSAGLLVPAASTATD